MKGRLIIRERDGIGTRVEPRARVYWWPADKPIPEHWVVLEKATAGSAKKAVRKR